MAYPDYSGDLPAMIKWVKVQQTDYNAVVPPGCVQEIYGQSAELMKGHKGNWTYLYLDGSCWTTDPDEGLSGLKIDFYPCPNGFELAFPNFPYDCFLDLGNGAGGYFTYLEPEPHYGKSNKRVVDIALYRTDEDFQQAYFDLPSKDRWNHLVPDICKGRGGDYLHLLYQTIDYY